MSNFFDAVIRFILDHNEAVVQWLFVLVVGWAALLLGMTIFRRQLDAEEGDEVAKGASQLSPETLQMITESAKLKDELLRRTKEIEALKSEVANAAASGGNTSALEAKITELEGKLAEYEILEDDIADLSMYKEENARLKKELEGMKGAGKSAASPEPTREPPPGLETAGPAPKPLKPDEIIDEFAHAVEKSKEVKISDSAAAEPSDDLLREFAESLEGKGGSSQEDLDADKMLAEVAALGDSNSDSGIKEDADMDKMAQEATKLLGGDS